MKSQLSRTALLVSSLVLGSCGGSDQEPLVPRDSQTIAIRSSGNVFQVPIGTGGFFVLEPGGSLEFAAPTAVVWTVSTGEPPQASNGKTHSQAGAILNTSGSPTRGKSWFASVPRVLPPGPGARFTVTAATQPETGFLLFVIKP